MTHVDEQIRDLLMTFFQDIKKVEQWLCTQNSMFGNTAPRYLMLTGRGDRVLNTIKVALDENKI